MCYSLWYNASTMLPAGGRPATSCVHYTTNCNTQSSARDDGQNNCPKLVEMTGIIYVVFSTPFTSSLLGPNILLSTLFSNTLSLRSSRIVNDQVSHPQHTIHMPKGIQNIKSEKEIGTETY